MASRQAMAVVPIARTAATRDSVTTGQDSRWNVSLTADHWWTVVATTKYTSASAAAIRAARTIRRRHGRGLAGGACTSASVSSTSRP